MTATEIMLLAIRAQACGDRPFECPALHREQLSSLYRISKSQDMAHLVSAELEKQGALQDAGELGERFRQQRLLAVFRCEHFTYELEQIKKALKEAEIRFIPLKGAVIRNYYPAMWMRTSCDIDVLVQEKELERAVKILCETLGYRLQPKKNYHDVSLYSPTGIHLELHFSILENMAATNAVLSNVWENAEPIAPNSCEYQINNEYFLFYHIAHMAYHFVSGGCGVKPFLDLFFLRTHMKYTEAAVRAYCKSCGMEKFYDAVLHLSDVWFGNSEHTDLTKEMQAFVLKGGVYGTLENRVAVNQRAKGGRLRYVFSRIFLSYSSLKIAYPILEKHPWLMPVMQIGRWFRLIFGGRLGPSVQELRVNDSLSRDEMEKTDAFLSQLGF